MDHAKPDYDSDKLDNLLDIAFEMLDDHDEDFTALPRSVATFLRVHGAQGVLDNGGYRYFFEKDWDGNPPFREFVDAYEEIGCRAQAAELARVVATFPFDEPHLHEELRNRYIEEFFDEKSRCVEPWGDALCGDPEVWKRLTAYAEDHEIDFRAP